MKNLIILFALTIGTKLSYSQKWSSTFLGKPSSRALYASSISKAIQNAWELELVSKGKKEMLLDEIIFGQEVYPKKADNKTFTESTVNFEADEVEAAIENREELKNDPVKKKKEISNPVTLEQIKPTNEPEIKIHTDEKEKISATTHVEETPLNPNNKHPLLIIDLEEIEKDSIYWMPQVSPMFPGGQSGLKKFFSKNVITPEEGERNIKGKVFIRFIVKKNGELSKIYLVKGLNNDFNKEAIRVVRKMPNWIPAVQEGKNVSAWYTLPIYFEVD